MAPGKTMDLVIMREATEGFYADRNMARGSGEMMPSLDMALAMRKITRAGSERIARQAFELAARRRGKVTAIHKANCFLMTCGLFLEACRTVAEDFADVTYEEMIVDAAAAHLVRNPEQFDVLCATNLFGDILSDLVSELSGSIALAGSINASETLCCAQAQHGSAPDIAGQDAANPTSMILSCAMMLDWLARGHERPALAEAAGSIEAAVETALARPETRTRDLGGPLGTTAFTEVVVGGVGG
jgi:3-isopropylmalate dehydrogenase